MRLRGAAMWLLQLVVASAAARCAVVAACAQWGRGVGCAHCLPTSVTSVIQNPAHPDHSLTSPLPPPPSLPASHAARVARTVEEPVPRPRELTASEKDALEQVGWGGGGVRGADC